MSRTTAPSASTNFGLETHFDLLPAGDESDEFYAILDCAPYIPRHTSSKARAAILLRFLGRNQYVRISSDEIFDIPTLPTSTVSKAIHTRVFVKQHSNSLAPALTLQGLNNIQACGGALTDVWPYDQWDAGKRKHQFLRDRGHVILAAFQFTFVAPVGNHAYLDIMVGQSRRFEDRTSQDLWISCSPSNSRTNLEWEMQNAERNSHHRRTKSVSYVHMIDTIPSVVISVDQQLDQGKKSFFLRFDKIHELSVVPEHSARRIDSDDSVIQKYEQIIGCVAMEDAASRSLCKDYSLFQEIRTIRPNRPSSCWETLDNLRRSAADPATVVDVLDPSRKPLDTFEAYFSTRLIKTCISGDGPGVEETLNSRLSTVCVNAWTSELRTTVEEFDPLKILEGFRPLHWAALFGHAEITAVLLYHGADPFLETCTGLTPMHVAIVMGHVGVLDQIFAANPSSKRWIDCTQSCVCDTLPNFAASYIRTEAIASVLDCLSRLLHSDGMVSTFDRPNALGENLLHRASASNNIFAAQWCVQRNRQLVYCRDKHGRTPLFHAAAAGSTEICQMLLDNGADPFAEDHLGRTPLYAACRQGHHLLVESFLQASIPFLQSDSDHTVGLGFNAWHFAALSCNPDVLRSLVPYANRSTATRTDMIGLSTGIAGGGYLVSPLHIASSIGTVSCVEILCRVGFDTTTKTRCGFVPESGSNRWRVEIGRARTAEEWADAYDDAKVVAVLRGYRPWMSGPTSEIAVR
jgi:ankyrin repeat protein